MDHSCGTGNPHALPHRYEHCTLPAGHPVWNDHPNGYRYNHHDQATGTAWNDPADDTLPDGTRRTVRYRLAPADRDPAPGRATRRPGD